MPHTKGQEKELNEMKEIKLTDAEFKIMVIRMLKDIRGRMHDLRRT